MTKLSSMRFKENIRSMGEFSYPLLFLRPVLFNYKDQETTSIGLIAEEVERHLPHLVMYDENNAPNAVRYQELPVLLLNEVQKIYSRVVRLEERLKQCKCVSIE